MSPSRPDARVLDRNIGLLLRRAYVPVLPAPEFRDRLASTWLAEVRHQTERRAARGAPRRRFVPAPVWIGLAAAAGVVALAWAGWKTALQSPEPRDAIAWVERGDVAVRTGRGAWRAATSAELAQGLALGAEPLEVVTPADLSLDVLASEGRVTAKGATRLRLEAGADGLGGLAGGLAKGRLLVARAAPGLPWVIRTEPGALVLELGTVAVEKAGALERFFLEAGRASYLGPGGPIELAAGEELRVLAGVPVLEVAAVGAARDERRVVETPPPVPQPDRETRPSLRGFVRAADGGAIPRFQVAVLRERVGNEYGDPMRREFEAADGAFVWEDLPAGRHRVFVHAEGYALASLGELAFGPEQEPAELDVRLQRGGTLRGHVVDRATGNPVPDALVLSERDAPQEALLFQDADRFQWLPGAMRTLGDGSFELSHLSPGAHSLRITAPGYGPEWTAAVEVSEGEWAAVTAMLVRLSGGGALEGRVTRRDGAPWVGAQLVVALMDQTVRPQMNFAPVRADADGRYHVEDLPPTFLLAILVDLAGGPPTVKPVEIVAGRTAVIDFLGDAAGVRLAGRVVTAGGEPIAHRNLGLFKREVNPQFSESFEASTTLADGSFAFANVEPGSYLIYLVEKMGRWIRLVDTVDVPAWGDVEHEVRVLDARISGRVLDGRNGEPLPGGALVLWTTDDATGDVLFAGNTRAGDDGRYELGLLNPGIYQVTAYPPHAGLGFERSAEVLLSELEPRAEVDLVLLAGGSVELRVVDRDGEPVPSATIELLNEAGELCECDPFSLTDEDGRHLAIGLKFGRYRATVTAAGYEAARVPFECRTAERRVVRVTLSPAERDESERTER